MDALALLESLRSQKHPFAYAAQRTQCRILLAASGTVFPPEFDLRFQRTGRVVWRAQPSRPASGNEHLPFQRIWSNSKRGSYTGRSFYTGNFFLVDCYNPGTDYPSHQTIEKNLDVGAVGNCAFVCLALGAGNRPDNIAGIGVGVRFAGFVVYIQKESSFCHSIRIDNCST